MTPFLYRLARRLGLTHGWPPVGWVNFGSLLRTGPINRNFGIDRGIPIDRFFIERFLSEHREDIHGRVLEIGDGVYTSRFAGDQPVQGEILHAVPGNPAATIVGRLDTGEGIPKNAFDCMILTQTLHCIFDLPSAMKNIYAALKPGGVVLASIPMVSQISRHDADRWGEYWRLTPDAARMVFGLVFSPEEILLESYGNVLLATAFLHGLVVRDVPAAALAKHDPDYPILVCIRAKRIA